MAGSLYKHSLGWMVREAQHHSLLIVEEALQGSLLREAGAPRKVESLRGAWNLAELAPRLHLQNQYPPARRRRLTIGLWRGRKLSDAHESLPEDLLTELRRKDHALRFLTSREKTLTRSSPGAPGGTMRAGSREGGG